MRQCIETLSKYRVATAAVMITIFTCRHHNCLVLLRRALLSGTVLTLVQGPLRHGRFLTEPVFINRANQPITSPSQEPRVACLGIYACVLSVMHNTYASEYVCAPPPPDVYISHSPKRDLFQGTNASVWIRSSPKLLP